MSVTTPPVAAPPRFRAPPFRGLARGLVAPLVLGAAFFAAVTFGTAGLGEEALVVLLIATLGFLLALPHAIRVVRGRWDPFDPLVAFGLVAGMGYFVRSMHLLWHERAHLYHIPLDRFAGLDLLAIGLALVILGVLSFYAGYGGRLGAALGARLPAFSPAWRPGRIRAIWMAFTVIGGIVYAVFVLHSGGLLRLVTNMELRSETSAGMHFYYMGIRLLPVGLLFRQILLVRRDASRFAWLGFGLHALVVMGLLSALGSRSWAGEVLIMMLVIHHLLRRPVRPRTLGLIAAAGLLTFAVYYEYRNVTHEGVEAGELRQMELGDFEVFYNGIIGHRNFDMMDNLLSIVHYTPERLPFLEGSSYLHFLVNMVPRKLWEGKPRGVGSILAEQVYGWGFGGAPPGAIGEAYFNYGWIGIIPALFLLGLLARTVAAYAAANRRNPFAAMLLAASFVFVLMVVRGSFYKVGSTYTMRLAPMFLGALFASAGMRVSRRRREAA